MRLFSILAIAAAALVGQASTLTTPMVIPVQTHVDAPTSFPKSTLSLSDELVNITVAQDHDTGLNTLAARQEFPATLLLCALAGCLDCSSFALANFPENQCFPVAQYFTVAISQPSGQGLPFVVGVGTTGCASLVAIPNVNTCFQVNGAVFNSFALLP